MSNLAKLKKTSNSIDRLNKELEKINSKDGNKERRAVDERIWRAEPDNAGNGFAIIRFLPGPLVDGDDALPWVRVWNHGFHNPFDPKGKKGRWYIENSLTTIKKEDPVSQFNSLLWNSKRKENQELVSKHFKRRLTYYSNILVISDPKNPQNEGKVFLFKYGKKIFDKITEAMNPQFADESPINPFDPWKGANFKLKMRKVDGYTNYDKSEFESPASIGTDEQIEEVWKKEYSLLDFVAPDKFGEFGDLKEKLDTVLGFDSAKWTDATGFTGTPVFVNKEETHVVVKTAAPTARTEIEEVNIPDADEGDEDEDVLARFAKLAED